MDSVSCQDPDDRPRNVGAATGTLTTPPFGLLRANPFAGSQTVRTIRSLTIGKSQKPELAPEILAMPGDSRAVSRLSRPGCCTGCRRRDSGPRDGEIPLVSRLRPSEQVIVGDNFVEGRMAARLSRVPTSDVTGILCMGPLFGICERAGLLKAGPIFDETLGEACSPSAIVGALIPGTRR